MNNQEHSSSRTGREWPTQARDWQVRHFAVSRNDADSVALLRDVANRLEELGNIEVLDITYQHHLSEIDEDITMTVYFDPRTDG